MEIGNCDKIMNMSQSSSITRWLLPTSIYAVVICVFVIRTILASSYAVPALFDIFNLGILVLSGGILIRWYLYLNRLDSLIAVGAGVIFGSFVNLTSFYPLLRFYDPILTSIGHGASLTIILAAALILMRKDGPVHFELANNEFQRTQRGILLGLLLGIPFAILNAVAFSLMQGQPFALQDPLISALGALQPGFVEEVVYRFTFLSMVWYVLKDYNPKYAIPLAAALALIVHNYAHLSDLFVMQPLFAIVYGAIVCILFGLPPTLLALRKNLECAIAFHWMVDFVRFLAGF
jgi:hypothetical protein